MALLVGTISGTVRPPKQRPSDALRQGRPLDQFEDQGLDALGLFQPVDGADVGMVQRGEDLGLALEAGQTVGAVNASGNTLSATSRSSFVSRAR